MESKREIISWLHHRLKWCHFWRHGGPREPIRAGCTGEAIFIHKSPSILRINIASVLPQKQKTRQSNIDCFTSQLPDPNVLITSALIYQAHAWPTIQLLNKGVAISSQKLMVISASTITAGAGSCVQLDWTMKKQFSSVRKSGSVVTMS